MKARLRSLALLLTWLMLGVSAFASAAAWHWAADLASHFPLHLASAGVCMGLLLLALGAVRSVLLATLVVAISVWRLAAAPTPVHIVGVDASATRVIGLLLWNIKTGNADLQRALDWIEALDPPPEVVALLETDRRLERALAARNWPWRVVGGVARSDNFGLLVMVRDLPAAARLVMHSDIGIPSAHVTLCPSSAQPLELLVIHPPPPMGRDLNRHRDRQLSEVARHVSALGPAVILAGDLNVTPWSPAYTRLLEGAAITPARERWLPPQTWAPRGLPLWLGIPIDHVLFKGPLRVLEQRVGPRIGSDHVPVITRFGLPAALCGAAGLAQVPG